MILKLLKYILYRIKWNLAGLINFKSPIHIDIELNNTCNQKCIYCWHSEWPPLFKKMTMPINTVFKYLEQGKKAGALSVKFNLRGEPTLNMQLLCDSIQYANQLEYIDIMINTNLCAIDKSDIDILNNIGLKTIIISYTSDNKLLYETIRGAGKDDYNNFINNLKYLRELYCDNKLKMRVKINYHKGVYNLDEYVSTRRMLLFEYGMFEINFRDIMPRRGTDKSKKLDKLLIRKKKCPHMMSRLTITANDKIYPCCMCYNEPEDIRLDTHRSTLTDLWNGLYRKDMLIHYEHGNYLKSCINCKSADIYK